MPLPASRKITIYTDDDYTHTITFTDPTVLDGWTFTAQLYQEDVDTVTFEVDDSQADDGVLVLHLTADQTRDLLLRPAIWDLQAERELDGYRRTIMRGAVKVKEDVTR